MAKRHLIIIVLVAMVFVAARFDYGKHFEIAKNIEIFANVYKEINANYVDETDPNVLMKAGIDAMLYQLDPFTNYISETQIENYRLALEGKYNGIGVKARKIGDYVTITEVYKDYPAFKAGLQVADQVIEVNGLDGKGKESEDLFHIMRGMPKSEVELKIRRPGITDLIDIKLVRDEVNIPNVPYSGLAEQGIGFIQLTTFTENAGKNVRDALQKLKSEHPDLKGIILDLRENGGGLLHEAVEVCNVFVPQGQLIASTRSKLKDRDQAYKTRQPALDSQIPLVVLINGRSASASEIVSGAMQDLDRGVVLGQISFGKGLVQNTKDVGYNAKVKLTIAKYYIPSGRCIQSVNYVEGKPVHLPDSMRVAFKTLSGRKVFDGGGVQPDIELPDANHPEIVQKLIDQNYIFRFATNYCLEHPEIKDSAAFDFVEFDRFLSFLKTEKFDDLNEFEQKLLQLDSLTLKADYQRFKESIAGIKKSSMENQWNELMKHRALINNILTEEIVVRSGYQEAVLKKRMAHDPVILEAIAVLKDQPRYTKKLKP